MDIKKLKDFDGKEVEYYFSDEQQMSFKPDKDGKIIFHYEATRGEYEWTDRYYFVHINEKGTETLRKSLTQDLGIKWKCI